VVTILLCFALATRSNNVAHIRSLLNRLYNWTQLDNDGDMLVQGFAWPVIRTGKACE